MKDSYFLNQDVEILDNQNLRDPQRYAYLKAYEYYNNNPKERTSIIVLPTGTGKTGLISILPFRISKGKVLIITPQLTIKDGILDSLTESSDNFLLKTKVIHSPSDLPSVIEYSKKTKNVLGMEDIVVLNIHRLQSRLDSSLINVVPDDYFDLIIIDEAHHSTAKTWIETVNYFKNSKVIKLTGTPFRSDNEKIRGNEIYHYNLSAAMANNYIKSLESFTYIPEELFFILDKDESKKYSVEEIRRQNLKDEDWISRSVAYSRECSEKVVKESIKLLEEKKSLGNTPHKIIAVACSIHHAEQIKEIYETFGLKSAILHSRLPDYEKEENFINIENHRVNVVINVAMLGEGYDHKYLSVAAIFRPFKSLLPYAQFIGRILRVIPEAENYKENIGSVISHSHLELQNLWNYYKIEIEKSKIIQGFDDDLDFDFDFPDDNKPLSNSSSTSNIILGAVEEKGKGSIEKDIYLETDLLKKKEAEEKELEQKISELIKILPNTTREKAKKIITSENSITSKLNRPDKYYLDSKKEFNLRIQEDIIPDLLLEFSIENKSDSLKNSPLFKNKNSFIPKMAKTNDGMLVIYFNKILKEKLGKERSKWDISDFNIAEKYLQDEIEYVRLVLEEFNKGE